MPLHRYAAFTAALTLIAPIAAFSSSPVVATIGDRTITEAQLETAGGRAVYDAAQAYYEARVRALYEVLSAELLKREADSRGLSVEQLLEKEVTPKVAPVSEGDIDSLLQARTGMNPTDPRHRKQAAAFISMSRKSAQQRQFVTTLFEKHGAKVMLAAPPAPPAEQVQGPLDPSIGASDAKVNVIVFSDYLCPYCRVLSNDLNSLLSKYPGQVKVVYRHFGVKDRSSQLATAAMCAREQQRIHDYHNALFATAKATDEDLTRIAKSLALDVETFDACVKSDRFSERLRADAAEGQRLGVQGTPTIFVNGVRHRGAIGLTRLTAAVDAALKSADSKTARLAPQ